MRWLRPLAGLGLVLALAGTVTFSAVLFRGRFTTSVPLTVISRRAGLVMNSGAKVELLGVQIGTVTSIEQLPYEHAELHLAVDPAQLRNIPTNVQVNIASPTVFGAKAVQMVPPDVPSAQTLQPGQVLTDDQVTVEFNTIFEKLSNLLVSIDPVKLNQTMGTLSSALGGRGEKLGAALGALDDMFTRLQPSLDNLSHDMQVAPSVIDAYADASKNLLSIAGSTSRISASIVDQDKNLSAFLQSLVSLSDSGNAVLAANGQGLQGALHLLLPTTDLTNKYHQGLTCGIGGIMEIQKTTPLPEPGVLLSIGFTGARERYRYPKNLPKVAATGGPICEGLPKIPFGSSPPFVVTDTGTNPAETGQQNAVTLNADGLKQILFGGLDGPPRNSAQIGQPG
ncbi:MCE family protein [Mycobacterium sp. OTB74]|uniref:MCE family protein n=1 Tax=Mycobacterium sp. OTB74 TaxID=1853452 RepID=UPI00247492B9|nr:MCE family protein [Mycobacterium sp. OTB74]MDH6246514.1 phospholipid/cholesterol/gamma-HCH transport system substrate-binding protein [Mycobacterium sp. OTB74]